MVRTYKKKRKFFGNQHVDSKPTKVKRNSTENRSGGSVPQPHVTHDDQEGEGFGKPTQSASARKIGEVPQFKTSWLCLMSVSRLNIMWMDSNILYL